MLIDQIPLGYKGTGTVNPTELSNRHHKLQCTLRGLSSGPSQAEVVSSERQHCFSSAGGMES